MADGVASGPSAGLVRKPSMCMMWVASSGEMKPGDSPMSFRLLAVSAALSILSVPAFAAGAQNGDPVVARVNGKELHRSEVAAAQRMLPAQLRGLPLEQIYPVLVDQMVSATLLAEAGRKDHLADDAEVKQRLARLQDRVIEDVYLDRLVRKSATDAALHASYDHFLKEHPPQEEVNARHILVAKEDEAKAIIADLDKGGDFAKLAKDHSTDPSKENGGDLGWFSRDQMVPEFADTAFKLKKGEYTKTPVKSQFGYHVIKLDDRRQGKPPTFEEAKDELTGTIARDVISKKVEELKASAKVETFALDGSPRPAESETAPAKDKK